MLTTAQIIAKYGQPGKAENFTIIDLPYPMRISWDKGHSIKKLQCHKLVADKFRAIFKDILAHYGLPKIQELGIDLYGGCYNFRKMRGGTDWSRHSWAIAIDLSPEANPLKAKWKEAQFSKPEYKPLIDIFYKHGFVNQGVEKGFDAMHWEVGS
jgi:hypothetical protein